MASEAQRAAVKKYDAQNTKRIYLKLNLNTDKDILERFEMVGNVQGYIKKLVRQDIAQSESTRKMQK